MKSIIRYTRFWLVGLIITVAVPEFGSQTVFTLPKGFGIACQGLGYSYHWTMLLDPPNVKLYKALRKVGLRPGRGAFSKYQDV